MTANETLINTLGNSQMYQDYEPAYTEATGRPATLRTVETSPMTRA
jgi:hypothetical protein